MISKTIRASDLKYISTGNDVINFSKSYKRNFGLCSGHDFSITVQPILKKFTVLDNVIQGLHLLFCNLLDILNHFVAAAADIDDSIKRNALRFA